MKPENKITTTVKGPVQQNIYYDPDSKKIQVVHVFNLKPGHDVILSRIDKYVINNENQKELLNKYASMNKRMLKRKVERFCTRFRYHFIQSGTDHPHARKFPVRGTFYPLSRLPHHIEVIVD